MVNTAHVAQAFATSSEGNGDINPATDKALTFHGAPDVEIPPGETVLSQLVKSAEMKRIQYADLLTKDDPWLKFSVKVALFPWEQIDSLR